MNPVIYFVRGCTPDGCWACDGPFDTYEEAILWADTHDYAFYTIVLEAAAEDLAA